MEAVLALVVRQHASHGGMLRRALAARMSIREYADVGGVVQHAPSAESTLLVDILFYLTHSRQHLGSVEALCGL